MVSKKLLIAGLLVVGSLFGCSKKESDDGYQVGPKASEMKELAGTASQGGVDSSAGQMSKPKAPPPSDRGR